MWVLLSVGCTRPLTPKCSLCLSVESLVFKTNMTHTLCSQFYTFLAVILHNKITSKGQHYVNSLCSAASIIFCFSCIFFNLVVKCQILLQSHKPTGGQYWPLKCSKSIILSLYSISVAVAQYNERAVLFYWLACCVTLTYRSIVHPPLLSRSWQDEVKQGEEQNEEHHSLSEHCQVPKYLTDTLW